MGVTEERGLNVMNVMLWNRGFVMSLEIET
jgi:hypothetical protein